MGNIQSWNSRGVDSDPGSTVFPNCPNQGELHNFSFSFLDCERRVIIPTPEAPCSGLRAVCKCTQQRELQDVKEGVGQEVKGWRNKGRENALFWGQSSGGQSRSFSLLPYFKLP